MRSIAAECESDPQLVLQAQHTTRISRLHEVTAAGKPTLRWKPRQQLAAAD
jgi:glycine dehydrogenase subunit 2